MEEEGEAPKGLGVLIRAVDGGPVSVFEVRFTLLTNGGNAHAGTRPSALGTGVTQFNITLDYLDERHDRRGRGFPGPLVSRVLEAISTMRSARNRKRQVPYMIRTYNPLIRSFPS